jgi:broad specificity phosphatase PhoE
MSSIYFIRHGETDWNAEGRLQGQTEQPLNTRGHVQAAKVGKTLASLLKGQFDLPFIASPMLRTRQTMEGLRSAIPLVPADYATDSRLIELTFGSWEGHVWPEIERIDPVGAAARDKDKWHAVPPGGESYAMLTERVRPFVETLQRPSVIVSHGGVARAFMRILSGTDPLIAAKQDIRQGSVLLFEGGRHRWVG